MEKVASDRHLLGSQGPAEGFSLRQPEYVIWILRKCFSFLVMLIVLFSLLFSMMNTGSPYNVSPGSQADLSHVVAHYQRKNQEAEADRVARMKDGKVVSLYE